MNASLRTIVAAAASLLTTDILNRVSTFVLYAIVARALGAHEFGQLALAMTLFFTFQVLATGGLKSLVTRDMSRDPRSGGLPTDRSRGLRGDGAPDPGRAGGSVQAPAVVGNLCAHCP